MYAIVALYIIVMYIVCVYGYHSIYKFSHIHIILINILFTYIIVLGEFKRTYEVIGDAGMYNYTTSISIFMHIEI